MEDNYDKYVERLFTSGKNIVRNWVDDEKQTISSWINLGTSLAEIIDKYKDITGAEKKSIVIKVVTLIIEDKDIVTGIDDDMRENICSIVKLTLPTTIDLIIKATQGGIKINKKCNFLCFECGKS